MRSTEDRETLMRTGSVSLILPMLPGSALTGAEVAEVRRLLEVEAGYDSVEILILVGRDAAATVDRSRNYRTDEEAADLASYVTSNGNDWSALVRTGLGAATGEHAVVLDLNRHYSLESLVRVVRAVSTDEFDLAVAVPRQGRTNFLSWVPARFGPRFISRMVLGTSDVFSGLFALRRAVWDSAADHDPGRGSRLVLYAVLRHQPRCVDVPVPVGSRFQAGHIAFKDRGPLKRILDGRFGNYSRLAQFCVVGASGMVVDLSFYALLQFLLSFTWLAERWSAVFGCTWHLAIAAGVSIALALVWNFILNRRLTFNDADRGVLLRQFFTYVLSNALAIVLSFSVRLYLPAHVGFFARHRLVAAVVGIVAATGISFSMSRWLVFARPPGLKRMSDFSLEQSAVGHQTTTDP